MQSLVTVTPPAAEPVSLAEAKLWLKQDDTADDTVITDLIVAAREAAELYTRRSFITQTLKLTLDLPKNGWADSLPAGTYDLPITALSGDAPTSVPLPKPPLQSITGVQTYDTANTASTFSPSYYFADTSGGRLVLTNTATWPVMRDKAAIAITYVAGYGAAASVPAAIKSAIKMHVQAMYDGRTVCEMPASCQQLLRQFKVYG